MKLPTYRFVETGEYFVVRWPSGRYAVGVMSCPYSRQFLEDLIIMHSEGPIARLRRAIIFWLGNRFFPISKDHAQHDHV